MTIRRMLSWKLLAAWLISVVSTQGRAEDSGQPVFARTNLVAWCIVPFDASHRGPAERATMLKQLGIERVAYDWRDQHVAEFEQEILEYKKHGLEYFAFWSWHPAMEPLIRKYDIHPQLWLMIPQPEGETTAQRAQSAAGKLRPMVDKAAELGCRIGLYNHGGWGGEPENMVEVCKSLRAAGNADHVGIVYNLHHGHDHIDSFPEQLKLMQPYLLCLNLNGMNAGARPKILPIGQGTFERDMLKTIRDSGYHGPIGILDHRPELDARESLQQNLDGLKQVLKEQGDVEALKTFQ